MVRTAPTSNNQSQKSDAGSALNVLSKFVSSGLIKRITEGQTQLEAQAFDFPAAILFADISGFTTLTEQLADQYGVEKAVGAEHLTLLLSEYFDSLNEVVLAHQGDVIKFAGDAVLIVFAHHDSAISLKRAIACGSRMQEVAKNLSDRFAAEHDVTLSLKVMVSHGEVRGMVLGGVFNRWEYTILSEALSIIGQLGDVALPGEVMITESQLNTLGLNHLDHATQYEGAVSVHNLPEWDLELEESTTSITQSKAEVLSQFVPAAVAKRLSAGQVDLGLVSELRTITVLFINLPNFTPQIELGHAQKIITTAQQVCYGQRGSIDKISSDDKGVSIIAGFGVPPMSAEDDAERAVKAALNLKKTFNSMGVDVSIGVATGPVYCGSLGDRVRCEYTLMGDGVNTAARLMTKAGLGVLCDASTRASCSESIVFEKLESLHLKGKTKSTAAFKPVADAGSPESNELKEQVLYGREYELGSLDDLLKSFQSSQDKKCVFLIGEAGMGKSALIQTFATETLEKTDFVLMRSSANNVQVTFYGVWRNFLLELLEFDESTTIAEKEQYLLNFSRANKGVNEEALCLLNEVLGVEFDEAPSFQRMQSDTRAENIQYLVRKLIRHKAAEQSYVLAIDDAQWMDSASWALLDSLVRELDQVFFCVALQPLTKSASINFDRLCEYEGTKILEISALGKDAVQELVCQHTASTSVAPDVVDLVYVRCEGNPHYAEVLTADLLDRELIIVDLGECYLAPKFTTVEEVELPPSIESALSSKVERLDLDQQLMIKTASVIGRNFDIDTLFHIYPVERQLVELTSELDSLSDTGIMQAQTRHVDYLFTHSATQRIAYDLLLYRQRKQMHEQVALWLESNQNPASTDNKDLADHWLRSEHYDKALEYYGQAIEAADQLFANREILEYADKIDRLISKNQTTVPSIKIARWAAIAGSAHLALGNPDKAEEKFNIVLKLLGVRVPKTTLGFVFKTIAEVGRQMRRRLTPTFNFKVAPEKKEGMHLAASAMSKLFLAYYYQKKMEGIFFTAFAATNLAEAPRENTVMLAQSYVNLGNAFAGIPLMGLSKAYLIRAKQVAIEVDDKGAWSWYYLAGGICKAQVGDWEGHAQSMENCRQVALSHGERRRWEEAQALHCLAGLLSGQFEPVDQDDNRYQQIYESGYRRGVNQTQSWGLCMWLLSALMQGDRNVAKSVADKLQPLFYDNMDNFDPVNILEVCAGLSMLTLRNGDLDQALELLKPASLEVTKWGRPSTWRSIVCTFHYTEASLRLWYQLKINGSENQLMIVQKWLIEALSLMKSHAKIFPVAVSRYELVAGWHKALLGKGKKAHVHFKKGLVHANKNSMLFDVLAISAANQYLSAEFSSKLEETHQLDIPALAKQLNVKDLAWVGDWREI